MAAASSTCDQGTQQHHPLASMGAPPHRHCGPSHLCLPAGLLRLPVHSLQVKGHRLVLRGIVVADQPALQVDPAAVHYGLGGLVRVGRRRAARAVSRSTARTAGRVQKRSGRHGCTMAHHAWPAAPGCLQGQQIASQFACHRALACGYTVGRYPASARHSTSARLSAAWRAWSDR